MGHKPDMIDIYSASWGPTDDGRTVDGPRGATMQSIVKGVNEVIKSRFWCHFLAETAHFEQGFGYTSCWLINTLVCKYKTPLLRHI